MKRLGADVLPRRLTPMERMLLGMAQSSAWRPSRPAIRKLSNWDGLERNPRKRRQFGKKKVRALLRALRHLIELGLVVQLPLLGDVHMGLTMKHYRPYERRRRYKSIVLRRVETVVNRDGLWVWVG